MQHLNRLLAPLKSRIHMMLARGIIKLVNDGVKIQSLQVGLLHNETRDAVQRFQEYGFSSHPLEGADCLVAFIGGNRDNGVVIAVEDRRYRIKSLEGGEVAIYSHTGDNIVIRNDGSIDMYATTKVRINAPLLEVTGDIVDQCETNTRSMAGMREVFNAHTHGENDGGSNTDVPGEGM